MSNSDVFTGYCLSSAGLANRHHFATFFLYSIHRHLTRPPPEAPGRFIVRHPLAQFAVVFLLLASAASNAAPGLPTGPASGAWLNGSLDLLEDPDGNLAVEDLEQAEQAGRFVAAA
ncbi:hypothetical protein HKW75_19435, partial [Pseudomonas aeruginosa]|nr:hypothetical protein [Pseudomonas aeruginosa]